VEEDWSMKDKVMREWSIEHAESNLRSTMSIWHCH